MKSLILAAAALLWWIFPMQADGQSVVIGESVLVQAPGVTVQVGALVQPSHVLAPVLIPRRVLVPRTLVVPGVALQPVQPVIVRRPYWTPVRDILFGRHRVRYVPIQ